MVDCIDENKSTPDQSHCYTPLLLALVADHVCTALESWALCASHALGFEYCCHLLHT